MNDRERQIVLLLNDSELGAGTRGSSLAYRAIQTAARARESDFFSRYPSVQIPSLNEELDNRRYGTSEKNMHLFPALFDLNRQEILNCRKNDQFPIILSGDHSNAVGFIGGLQDAFQDDRIGVLWIDAHADLHSPYTSPSGNVHGMTLAIVSDTDNAEYKIRDLHVDTIGFWNDLKSKFKKPLDLKNVGFIGLRSAESQEMMLIEENSCLNISVGQYRQRQDLIAQDLRNFYGDCDKIYVSLDVDSMDPDAVSDGTGTPVPNGLYSSEVMKILDIVVSELPVACFEITEVNPTLDSKKNKMAETAFEILESFCASLMNKEYRKG